MFLFDAQCEHFQNAFGAGPVACAGDIPEADFRLIFRRALDKLCRRAGMQPDFVEYVYAKLLYRVINPSPKTLACSIILVRDQGLLMPFLIRGIHCGTDLQYASYAAPKVLRSAGSSYKLFSALYQD